MTLWGHCCYAVYYLCHCIWYRPSTCLSFPLTGVRLYVICVYVIFRCRFFRSFVCECVFESHLRWQVKNVDLELHHVCNLTMREKTHFSLKKIHTYLQCMETLSLLVRTEIKFKQTKKLRMPTNESSTTWQKKANWLSQFASF